MMISSTLAQTPLATSSRCRGRSPRVSPSLFYNAGTSACEKVLCLKGSPGPPGRPESRRGAPRRLRGVTRCPKTGPRRFRDAQEGARTAQEGPKASPKTAQDGPETSQGPPKTAQEEPDDGPTTANIEDFP